MKRILLTLLPLALAACASAPPTDTTQASDDKGTVCDRDSRTGSMLPTTRCTTAAEREATQRSVQSVSEAVRNQRANPPGKGS